MLQTSRASSGQPVAAKASAIDAISRGSILPVMLRLAAPTIGVLIVQTLVGLVETFYVSFIGTEALVGVSLVFPIWMFMTMTSSGGIGGGVASAISRAVGAGRREEANALVFQTGLLALGFGALFTVFPVVFGPVFFGAMGGSGAALDAALLYSRCLFMCAVPLWAVNLFSSALRGIGNVRVPAAVTLLAGVVLTPLSPVLIFGIGPFKGFGIAGPGIAITLYYSAAAVWLARYLMKGRSGLVLGKSGIDWHLLGEILRVGLISALNAMQINLTAILLTGLVGGFGTIALAGYGIASRLDYVLMPLLFGLGTSVLSMVGINVGAGNFDRAKRVTWIGTLVGALGVETIGLLAAVFPRSWVGLFSQDASILDAGATYLSIVGPLYGASGVTFILTMAAIAGGRPIWTVVGGTARLLVAVGLGWWFVRGLGAEERALYWTVAASYVASALVCVTATLLGLTWRTRGDEGASGVKPARTPQVN